MSVLLLKCAGTGADAHGGEWVPRVVLAWSRNATGWRGLVRYDVRADQRQLSYLAHCARGRVRADGLLVSYEQWRPAAQIRPG